MPDSEGTAANVSADASLPTMGANEGGHTNAAAAPMTPVPVQLREGLASEAVQSLPPVLERKPWPEEHGQNVGDESIRRAKEEFRARPTDVICDTFPKTGTTLVQWICHQLRTGGHVDFEDLYQVSPWIQIAHDIGLDPNVDGSQFMPRVFKSHLPLSMIYPGCKYIVTIREPSKAAISFYHFLFQKRRKHAINSTLDSFVLDSDKIKGNPNNPFCASIWDFYREYWLVRDCPSVLVVVYEDLVRDMAGQISLISDFIGVEPTSALVQRVAAMSTKEFMAEHATKMDESWAHVRALELGRCPDPSRYLAAERVVKGSHTNKLGAEAEAFLEQRWQEEFASSTGHASYSDFSKFFSDRNAVRIAELQQAFPAH